MNNRKREKETLSFRRPDGRGSVEETFFPWDMTVKKFVQQGLPCSIADPMLSRSTENSGCKRYLDTEWGKGIMDYEQYLGFDAVYRIFFPLPFRGYKRKDNDKYKHAVTCMDDFKRLREYGNKETEKYFTDNNVQKAFSNLKDKHIKGEFTVRLNIEGFFWAPRALMGIEPHMYAFYDCPELIHAINEYVLSFFCNKLEKVLDVVPADIVYICEDLSGKNGPMLSPQLFDEFVGCYYKRLIPILKDKGAGNVFVDTDGEFKAIIPRFIDSGVDGFLPMDVNAGMDVVELRNEFPHLKFIGAFNKLCISEGRESIDREFERILPVIRQGGFIPGCDHQVAPSATFQNYKYYISRLRLAMKEAGIKTASQ